MFPTSTSLMSLSDWLAGIAQAQASPVPYTAQGAELLHAPFGPQSPDELGVGSGAPETERFHAILSSPSEDASIGTGGGIRGELPASGRSVPIDRHTIRTVIVPEIEKLRRRGRV